jgi:hypothetical protein
MVVKITKEKSAACTEGKQHNFAFRSSVKQFLAKAKANTGLWGAGYWVSGSVRQR